MKTNNAQSSGHSMAKSHSAGIFIRHFFEMFLAMVIGMLFGGIAFWAAAGATGTFDEAGARLPTLLLIFIAFFMTVPMVAWMRVRGHIWRICSEMAAAMIIPAIPFILLTWFRVITWPVCGLYCVVTIPAMIIAMLLRRSEYSQHRHASSSHQHTPA